MTLPADGSSARIGELIGGRFEVTDPGLVATDGGKECVSPMCRRVSRFEGDIVGRCVGYHCAACGKSSSYQGHYSRLAWWDTKTQKPVMLDDWGFSCQPEYKERVAALRKRMEADHG